jgi:hypothetical protein
MGIVTMFCRLQTVPCRELQVKREQLGSRFVDCVVCIGFVSVPAGGNYPLNDRLVTAVNSVNLMLSNDAIAMPITDILSPVFH